MEKQKSGISRLFSSLWGLVNGTRKLIINLIFFTLLIVILASLGSDDNKIKIDPQTALVLNLQGKIVEQLTAVDPMEKFIEEAGGEKKPDTEVLLSDVVKVLTNAAGDDRIKTVVLHLPNMQGGGLNKLKLIGEAVNKVKDAGKPVYAIGNYFSQSQYYLASYADRILLHPMGAVELSGFSAYSSYYKSALEKLKITTHVFRVGTYKSAVEPILRDDMSKAAKKANNEWISSLWLNFKTEVAARRNIQLNNFDEDLDQFKTKFDAVNGDFAQYALQYGWVDHLAEKNEMREIIAEVAGWNTDKTSFNQISYKDYLSVIKPPIKLPVTAEQNIAVVYARGVILDGHKKAGEIGGDSTAKLLQRARLNDDIKAVVIRIDSPGGSAFASEVIRKEIDLLQEAGKPVVASMSSVAASGGYWIASSTDEIWAAPTTITGSIGIFGMFMTFENTLDYLGIHTDGVGTTDWSGFNVMRPLDKRMSAVLQRGIENGYDRFISLVAEHRGMSKEEVDKVAQGRVWTGLKAKELGLVDNLGNLDDAIASAAKLAKLETFDYQVIEKELSQQEILMKQIFGQASHYLPVSSQTFSDNDKLKQLVINLISEFDAMTKLNDPRGIYAMCVACPESD